MTGRLPIIATGTLTTKDGVGRFALESAEVSGVTIPKTVLQELPELLLAHEETPNGINMDDPFELGTHPRDQGRQGHVHHRPMNPAPSSAPIVPLATGPSAPEWIPSRRRFNTSKASARGVPRISSVSVSPPSRICCALSDALRGPWRVQDDRLLETGHGGLNHGRRDQLRRPSDPAAALQDLRDAGARSHWRAPRGLVQSAVPRRRLPSPSTCRPVRQAGAVLHGLQLQNPQYEIVRAEGDDESVDGETPAPATPRACTPAASFRSTKRPAR